MKIKELQYEVITHSKLEMRLHMQQVLFFQTVHCKGM